MGQPQQEHRYNKPKQSDATLGYERVYDTRTKEIYRAAKGFTSSYKGKGYKPVTDDNMYTTPISGYIEKTDNGRG